MSLVVQRPATAGDRNRYLAQLPVSEAKIAYWEKREGAARLKGMEKLSRAGELFRAAGDEINTLGALMHWIVFARSGDEYAEVVRLATQSRCARAQARQPLRKACPSAGPRWPSWARAGQGLDQAKESLAIWESLDNDYGRAFQLTQLSGLYLHVGDKVRAVEYIDQTAALSKRMGERSSL